MINTGKKHFSYIASVLAGVYILIDVLLIAANALVFGHATITMIAVDIFGLITCVFIFAVTFDRREIEYRILSFLPLIVGFGKIISIIPGVLFVGLGAANREVIFDWGIEVFGGILYIIISALYYVKRLSPVIISALYALPVVYSIAFGDISLSHMSGTNSAAPLSVNLLMILSKLNSVKGILLIAAIVLLTLCFHADITVRRKGFYIESRMLTAAFGAVTVLTAVALIILTFRYYTGYEELFWYESTYKGIAEFFSFIRALAQCGVGVIALYTAVKETKKTDRILDKAISYSVKLVTVAEVCYVAMETFTMLDSDGEGLGDLLLIIWLPVAIVFTVAVFIVANIFSYDNPSVSIWIITAYFFIQMSIGFLNYFSVYPSKMLKAELICVISVMLTLYFTAGLQKRPKTKLSNDRNGKTADKNVYYYPNINNELK